EGDGGGLKGAERAKGEKFWIAGARAHQRDGASLGTVLVRLAEQRVEIALRRFMPRMFDRKSRKQLPEPPPRGRRKRGRLHRPAPAARRLRPAGKAAWEHRFELRADRLSENRRRAVGRNADYQRRAVDDGAE